MSELVSSTRGNARPELLAIGGVCSILLLVLACAGPEPKASNPLLRATIETIPGGKASPLDGLWKVEGGEAQVQLERGRMYLHSGFAPDDPDEWVGAILFAAVRQVDATHYRCTAPSVTPAAELDWLTCALTVGADRSLTVTWPFGEPTADRSRGQLSPNRRARRFEVVTLADEAWFAAQAGAASPISAEEVERAPAEAPVLAAIAPLQELPATPALTSVAFVPPSRTARFGRYHALVIGSGDYVFLPAVATAVADADAVSRLLADHYGFDVTDLRNPNLDRLIAALEDYQVSLRARDNLLIYWAGHGFQSGELGRCSWVPVDALGDDPSEGVANAKVAAILLEMKAKHVIIVADSCFTAGELREAELIDGEGDAHLRLSKLRTRVALTSGGLEPVQDGQGSGHSVFTGAFLAALEENAAVLDGTSLFTQISLIVTAGASQTPEYANIHGARHEGGDFLFVRTE